MMNLLVIWLCSAALLFFSSQMVIGFEIHSLSSALFISILVGMVNIFIRPLLSLLALPINLITLGFSSFITNAVILMVADGLTPDLTLSGWDSAIFAAIFLAAIQLFGNLLLPGSRNFLSKY